MEQQEKQDKTIRKLKKQLKLYVRKVEDFEGNHIAVIMENVSYIELAYH